MAERLKELFIIHENLLALEYWILRPNLTRDEFKQHISDKLHHVEQILIMLANCGFDTQRFNNFNALELTKKFMLNDFTKYTMNEKTDFDIFFSDILVELYELSET